MTPEARELVSLAMAHGFHFDRKSKNGHLLYLHENGTDTVSISPNIQSHARAYANSKADIQRMPQTTSFVEDWPIQWQTALIFAATVGWKQRAEVNGGVRLSIPGAKSILVRKPDSRRSEKDHERDAYALVARVKAATPEEAKVRYAMLLESLSSDELTDMAVSQYVPPGREVAEEREHVVVERTVVKSEPWKATRVVGSTGAQLYDSDAVVQRTWSDGAIDYACPRCDYSSGVARSVASHFGAAHSRGKGKQPQGEIVAIDPERHYNPTERLVKALTAYLREQEELDSLEEQAVAALRWFHLRPDLGDPEERTREMHRTSSDVVVEKIRDLLGVDPRIAQAEAERDRWKEEARIATETLARVQGDLSALREMVASIGQMA